MIGWESIVCDTKTNKCQNFGEWVKKKNEQVDHLQMNILHLQKQNQVIQKNVNLMEYGFWMLFLSTFCFAIAFWRFFLKLTNEEKQKRSFMSAVSEDIKRQNSAIAVIQEDMLNLKCDTVSESYFKKSIEDLNFEQASIVQEFDKLKKELKPCNKNQKSNTTKKPKKCASNATTEKSSSSKTPQKKSSKNLKKKT